MSWWFKSSGRTNCSHTELGFCLHLWKCKGLWWVAAPHLCEYLAMESYEARTGSPSPWEWHEKLWVPRRACWLSSSNFSSSNTHCFTESYMFHPTFRVGRDKQPNEKQLSKRIAQQGGRDVWKRGILRKLPELYCYHMGYLRPSCVTGT